MGGVCPCLAGAEKSLKDAPKKPAPVPEKKPLIEPTTQPASKVEAAPAAVSSTAKDSAPDFSYSAFLPDDLAAKAAPVAAPAPAETDAQMTSSKSMPPVEQTVQPIGTGSCVEIYSNSYKAWCPGVVFGIDAASILVAYQVPGEPADANISTKTLPVDSEECIQPTDTGSWLTASVEVYSHSNKAWCIGKVTEISGGLLSVVFFYPNDTQDDLPVQKQLPLGDNDLRLRGIDAAFQSPAAGVGHDTLQVGAEVEVYSNSLGVWCPGVIQGEAEGVFVVAFFYPDMDPSNEQPVTKELPVGHQDLRIPGYVQGAAAYDGPPVTEADLKVGGQLEVFSQSRQAWIMATVAELADGVVTVQLRYPDMPPDSEVYEKVLQIGQDMRIPVQA